MNESKQVSIVVPVYGVEKYLNRCVDSILNQTYQNLQVILVDDESPDNCGRICDEYARKDSRVLSLHKPNGGVSSARNFGLEYVKGEYVTFCDSDDAYAPEWVEKLVAAMESKNADVALGCFLRITEDGNKAYIHETGKWVTDSLDKKVEYCFTKLLRTNHGWEVWTRLFRSDIIKCNEIRFCETCANYAEDMGFSLAYSLYADRIASIDFPGYLYTIRENSMMQKSTELVKLDSLHQVILSVTPHIEKLVNPKTADKLILQLYTQIISVHFTPKLWTSNQKPEEFRQRVVSDAKYWQDMKKYLKRSVKGRNGWIPYYSGSYNAEIRCHIKYLLSGHFTSLRIQCKLINVFRPIIDMAGTVYNRYAGI